jgi:hypothetical protein
MTARAAAKTGSGRLDGGLPVRHPHLIHPMGTGRQLTIPFDEAPRWDAAALEDALASAAGRALRLVLTDNRSVLLSFRREGRVLRLRLHRMFLHAPDSVVSALGRNLRRRGRAADGEVRRFMNANLHRVRRTRRPMPEIVTSGHAHDLSAIYGDLNGRFFGGRLAVPITWGRGVGRARRGGLTFGSYDPVLALIRIHPVLDRADVPRYFVESVVYHEMLHHHLGGVPDRAGRTVYHTRAFRDAEARFPRHHEALAWEKENLARLLAASHSLDRARRTARLARAAARSSLA